MDPYIQFCAKRETQHAANIQETSANERETTTSGIVDQVEHESLESPESTGCILKVGKRDYDRSETLQRDPYNAPSAYQHGKT